MPIRNNVKQTKEDLSKWFLKPNRLLKSVHGVGIGRTNENKYTNRIYVTQIDNGIFQQIREALSLPHPIPNSSPVVIGAAGVPNQITIEIVIAPQATFASNDFTFDNDCKRLAPVYLNPTSKDHLGKLYPGISVWLKGSSRQGTIGYFCKKKNPTPTTFTDTFLLSNSHILAGFGTATVGSRIYRNGKIIDPGIAQLSNPIINIKSEVNNDFFKNKVDAAIAKVIFNGGSGYEARIRSIQTETIKITNYCPIPNSITDLPVNQVLRKHGRGSCWGNKGFIDDVDCDLILIGGNSNTPLEFLFVSQYRIVAKKNGSTVTFATEGDSGSLVFDNPTNGVFNAVGLLFAVGFDKSFKRTTNQPLPDTKYALANPISNVMTELGIELILYNPTSAS